MFEYKIEHCRKNVLQDTLDRLSKEGWKLHSIFQEASGYMLVLERSLVYLYATGSDNTKSVELDPGVAYTAPEGTSKRKTRKPVNLGEE